MSTDKNKQQLDALIKKYAEQDEGSISEFSTEIVDFVSSYLESYKNLEFLKDAFSKIDSLVKKFDGKIVTNRGIKLLSLSTPDGDMHYSFDKLDIFFAIKLSIPLTSNSFYSPAFWLQGSLKIGNLTLRTTADILGSNAAIFRCSLEEGEDSGKAFDSLLGATGVESSSSELKEFTRGNSAVTFSMENLTVYYLRGSFSKISTKVMVSNLPALKVAGNEVFKVDNTVIKLSISSPFDSKSRAISIENWITWKLGNDTRILTYGKLPGGILWGGIAPKDSINFTQLIKEIASINDNVSIPILELLDLEIFYNYTSGNFLLNVRISSDLEVGPIKITGIDAEVQYDPQSGFIVNLSGYFRILKSMSLLVKVEYNEGWNFFGATGNDEEINITELIEHLAQQFKTEITIPKPIESLVLKNLTISFDAISKDFSFSGEADLSLNNTKCVIKPNLSIIHNQDGNFEKKFSASLIIAGLEFDLVFDEIKENDSIEDLFVASYHNILPQKISLKELSNNMPDISFNIKDALLAYYSSNTDNDQKHSLFVVNIDEGINLSNLPLVGKSLPANQSVKMAIKFLYASEKWEKNNLDSIDNLVEVNPTSSSEIEKGLDVATTINLGQETIELNLPIIANEQSTTDSNKVLLSDSTNKESADSSPIAIDASAEPEVKWFTLQKKLGPIYFRRIGVNFNSEVQTVKFLLDASLNVNSLTLSLDGLSVSSHITKFDPKFNLSGLGIDFSNGALEIGGAFLRQTTKVAGKEVEEYSGEVIMKMEDFTLSALGSYADLNGHPSLFIYALLEYSLGGPPFFFVEGLSAGFGYNRKLKLPDIDNIKQFPLIADVISDKTQQSDSDSKMLTNKLQELQQYVPPKIGDIFFAVGVKFTSFKLVNSFALLSASFGDRFELDLLGISTMITPPGSKLILAKVEMLLKATLIPDEGTLKVRAKLTPNSFILDEKCRLTGEFAFYAWFSGEHKDDFVITLGGYHPKFTVPAHYPTTQLLAINWPIDDHMKVKGSAYFALCSHVLMAGGRLEMEYTSSVIRAWFICAADFLIAWKPYHYEADMYVDVGASYTYTMFGVHHITVNIGADLHLEGPEFSGYADINLWITTINIKFGNTQKKPDPLTWQEFKSSFLPEDNQICSVTVSNGLISQNKTDQSLGIINPKELKFSIDSIIPIISTNKHLSGKVFGIGSMGILEVGKSHQTINIRKDGKIVDEKFIFTPTLKKVPTSLWGGKIKPNVNDNKFIEGALTGFAIYPQKTAFENLGDIKTYDLESNKIGTEDVGKVSWQKGTKFIKDSSNKKSYTGPSRDLLNELGMTNEIINLQNPDFIFEPIRGSLS